jgi:hypothetical protein
MRFFGCKFEKKLDIYIGKKLAKLFKAKKIKKKEGKDPACVLSIVPSHCHVLKIQKVWQPYTSQQSIFHWRKKRRKIMCQDYS